MSAHASGSDPTDVRCEELLSTDTPDPTVHCTTVALYCTGTTLTLIFSPQQSCYSLTLSQGREDQKGENVDGDLSV